MPRATLLRRPQTQDPAPEVVTDATRPPGPPQPPLWLIAITGPDGATIRYGPYPGDRPSVALAAVRTPPRITHDHTVNITRVTERSNRTWQ